MKVMIIDDEIYFREALKKTIPWEQMQLEICGEAADGVSALELAAKLHPDIILADINMPKMNGLEFVRRVKEADEETKIIIISGYDEFEYARQALTLGVNDYLLKPVSEDELCTILKKLATDKQKERLRKLENNKKRKDSNKNKNIAERYFLNAILTSDSRKQNEQYLRQLAEAGSVLCTMKQVRVAALEIDYKWEMSYEDQELWNFTVKNILEELLEGKAGYKTCMDEGKRLILILNADQTDEEEAEELLRRLQNIIGNDFEFSVSIGVSDVCRRLADLNKGYMEAIKALSSKPVEEKNAVIFHRPLEEEKLEYYYIQPQLKMQLSLLLRERKVEKIKELVLGIFDDIGKKSLSQDGLRIVTMDILTPCLQYIEEKQLMFSSEKLGDSFSVFEHVKMKRSLPEFCGYVIEICSWICSQNFEAQKEKVPNAVAASLDYIKENYRDPALSVDVIAKSVYSNYNYLCVLFKKTLGITINDFILKYRMQKAMELIHSGSTQVTEVAEGVGYENVNYFTKCFKKELGIPPSKYITFIEDYKQFYSWK